jgi:hypothetical protein
MRSVRIVANPVHAARLGAFGCICLVWSVKFDSPINQGAESGVLGTYRAVAIDGTEIVPEVVLGGLEIVLDLDDACWSNAVVWKISYLDRETATELLGVDHVVNDGARVTRDHDAFVIFAISGSLC